MPKTVQEKARVHEEAEPVTQVFPVRKVGEAAVTGAEAAEEQDVLATIEDVLAADIKHAEELDALMAEIDLIVPVDSQAYVESYRQVNGQ